MFSLLKQVRKVFFQLFAQRFAPWAPVDAPPKSPSQPTAPSAHGALGVVGQLPPAKPSLPRSRGLQPLLGASQLRELDFGAPVTHLRRAGVASCHVHTATRSASQVRSGPHLGACRWPGGPIGVAVSVHISAYVLDFVDHVQFAGFRTGDLSAVGCVLTPRGLRWTLAKRMSHRPQAPKPGASPSPLPASSRGPIKSPLGAREATLTCRCCSDAA